MLAGCGLRDVAESLGCSDRSLHIRVKRHQFDRRERDDGLSGAEREELRELRKRSSASNRSATSSSEPRFFSQRRPRPGEHLSDHLGGRASFPVSVMCEVLGVSRSGFRGWESFGQQARDAGIAVSMGSRGDAYDNAAAESFRDHQEEGARAPPARAAADDQHQRPQASARASRGRARVHSEADAPTTRRSSRSSLSSPSGTKTAAAPASGAPTPS